jgi:hypothetical protein
MRCRLYALTCSGMPDERRVTLARAYAVNFVNFVGFAQ